MIVDSLNELKDGRITVSSNRNLYIYDNIFSEKKEILSRTSQYHYLLKNGNFLGYDYPTTIFRISYYNKYEFVQEFPDYFCDLFCECKNYLFTNHKRKSEIKVWKYDEKEKKYFFFKI